MRRLLVAGLIFPVSFFYHPAWAADKVVVVPFKKNLNMKNQITVGTRSGDFRNPVSAVNSIKDAGENNPYIVVIGPGVYTLNKPLVLKGYVAVVGAGENATRLEGAITGSNADENSAVVALVSNSSLSGVTVENTGGGDYAFGVYCVGAEPRIENVTSEASGATTNVGVYNYSASSIMKTVTVLASGGNSNFGVLNVSSTLTMNDITANATGGAESFGVFNNSSTVTMTNMVSSASNGTDNRGVYNNFSFPTMMNVSATGSGGSLSYGVHNYNSFAKIRISTLQGGSYGIYSEGGAIGVISQSSVLGGSYAEAGVSVNVCTFSDNGSGGALNNFCL